MLRDYQIELLPQVLGSKAKSVCVQAPTGTGKTTVMCAVAQFYHGKKILFIAHRQRIIRQIHQRLASFGIRAGIIAPWAEPTNDLVQVASIQTISRRDARSVDIIIVDECHHSVASNYRKIFSSYEYEKHYGFTATPERLDGRGLGEVYEDLITTHSPAWFIKHEYLAPYKYYMSRPDQQVNLSSLGVRAGEFKMEQAAQYFSTSTVYGNIVEDWKRLGQDGQTVGFACTINQATELAEKFNENGIPSAVIHGRMSAEEQETMLSQFDALQIRVLWSVDVLGEGVDLPECQVAILARPTLSLSVYLQQVGRVLRPKKDGRHAIIIDHALNLAVHDYPCVQRNWTLEGQKRKDRKVEKKDFKVCRACGYVNAPDSDACEECQAVFAKPRVIHNKTATTVSMDVEDKAQDKGQDFSEYIKLLNYAAKKGYNHGWACHQAIQKGVPVLSFHAGKNLYAKFRKQYHNQASY